VLAGGSSRRLGGVPKGLEKVGGKRIVDRVVAALREVTPDLLFVANDPDAHTWLPGVAVVSDLHPGAGGLAGVEAALSGGRDVIVVAWDMPFVSGGLLGTLLETARTRGAEIVLPESESPYGFEPFCAFYSTRVLPSLSVFLGAGGGAARDFLNRYPRAHRVPLGMVKAIADPRRLFFSVNTPEDLETARTMAAQAK
jgi:molybdopterin-guanine dinucleotide biosynthesis protein A